MSSLKKVIIWFVLALLGGFLVLFLISEVHGKMLVVTKKEHEAFFKKLKQRGLSDEYVSEIFSDERAKLDLRVLEKKKPVDYFSKEFGLFESESIARGKRVLAEQGPLLQKVEDVFGIPKEFSVSIFRLETNFGSFKGEFVVFNALYTHFVFKKKEWADRELVNFFVLCQKHRYDLLSINGSGMGCFGLFQFIPSSFLDFAIDGDGDGRIDLFKFPDALWSAANHLRSNGWKTNDKERIRRALLRYNKSEEYGKAILAYGETIAENISPLLVADPYQLKSFIEIKYNYEDKPSSNKNYRRLNK